MEKTAQCTLCQEDVKLGKKKFDKGQHKRDVQLSLTQTPLWRQVQGNATAAGVGSSGGTRPTSGAGAGAGAGAAATRKPTMDKKSCGVCKEVFKSRNALFKHVKEMGHHNRQSKK